MKTMEALIDAYLDRHLTPEQAQELAQWIAADPEHARQFARELMLHRAMRDEFTGAGSRSLLELNHNAVVAGPDDSQVWEALLRAEETSEPMLTALPPMPAAPTSPEHTQVDITGNGDDRQAQLILSLPGVQLYRNPNAERRARRWGRWLAAALVLVAVGLSWYSLRDGGDEQDVQPSTSTPQVVQTPQPIVGRLTQTYGAQWEGDVTPTAGMNFRAGDRLHLVDGFAEVRLDRGATIVLQGPCDLAFHDENRVRLNGGMLVAHVPMEAVGFAVQTPRAILVDHGTEFGVTVDETGATETTVFEGAVALSNAVEVAEATETRLVVKGWNGRLEAEGTIALEPQRSGGESGHYVRRISVSPYLMQVYRMNPDAYWRFTDVRSDLVLNHLNPNGYVGVHQGATGMRLVPGPDILGRDNQALLLAGDTYLDFGDVLNFDRDNAFSFAFWVRPDSDSNASIFSRMDVAKPHRGYDVYLTGMQIEFQLKHSFYVRPHNAVRVVARDPLTVGEWVHVVLTYDGSSKASGVRIYLNGEPAAMQVRDDALTDTIRTTAPFRIGRRTDTSTNNQLLRQSDTEGTYHFVGGLDELMVFQREITAEEVAALYQSFGAEAASD